MSCATPSICILIDMHTIKSGGRLARGVWQKGQARIQGGGARVPCPPPHFLKEIRSISRGAGPPPPLSESLGVDFHSGFRQKIPGIHFYSGFREKKHMGGGMQFEILKNPGIDFYSGFRKKNPGIHFYSGFRGKKHKGGAIRNPKKSRYILMRYA